jgi:hypothetical protein
MRFDARTLKWQSRRPADFCHGLSAPGVSRHHLDGWYGNGGQMAKMAWLKRRAMASVSRRQLEPERIRTLRVLSSPPHSWTCPLKGATGLDLERTDLLLAPNRDPSGSCGNVLGPAATRLDDDVLAQPAAQNIASVARVVALRTSPKGKAALVECIGWRSIYPCEGRS